MSEKTWAIQRWIQSWWSHRTMRYTMSPTKSLAIRKFTGGVEEYYKLEKKGILRCVEVDKTGRSKDGEGWPCVASKTDPL